MENVVLGFSSAAGLFLTVYGFFSVGSILTRISE
ncbi:hypothetical protein SAMN05444156_2451 [Verrucomicrobium sp. GAS474]|nr:hypothetical protein SAMN05444156_2451 [Verrucomicrobium sp. GAS474]